MTPPKRTAQADRALPEIRPASGIVNEPMIGTKTVSRVVVSMFIGGCLNILFRSRFCQEFFTGLNRLFTAFSLCYPIGKRRLVALASLCAGGLQSVDNLTIASDSANHASRPVVFDFYPQKEDKSGISSEKESA